ncbi:hypothetical protein KFE25_010657 [Diacronema lutheri]|uniref:Cysteine-rich protein 1 n=1 Tax=Diacronema lutheri TaxID=2081491 RepID=A0A8J5X8T1_DIALT|nr:hypothetical protein KFE25_010657 [Diacronema lutheri]
MGKCQSKSAAELGQLSQLKEDVRIIQYGRNGVAPLHVTTTAFSTQTMDEEPATPATAMLDEHDGPESAPAAEPESVVLCVETDGEDQTLLAKEPTPMQKMLSPLYAITRMLSPPPLPKPPSPIQPNPAQNGMLHESGCPWCGDRVFMAERLLCFGREWHKKCFKCIECSKTLTLGSQLDHDKKPYCKACHTRSFGPKGYGFGGAVSAALHAGTGAQAEVIEAAAHSSDLVLEHAMVEWVGMVAELELGEPPSVLELKDGVALCLVLNKLQPGVVRLPFARPRTPFNELENLGAYARGCAELGMPAGAIFPPGALHQAADLDLVVANLHHLFEFSRKIDGFGGGRLNEWMLDKRVRKWLSDVSGTSVMAGDLHAHLRDGIVLCRVANAIEPGAVQPALLKPATSKFGTLETIAAFLEAAREVGVAEHDLFHSKDLYDGSQMGAVVRAVIALARVASRRPGYAGATLELPPQSYEESVAMHRDSILSSNAQRASTARDGAPAKRSVGPYSTPSYAAPYGSENVAPGTQRVAPANGASFGQVPVLVTSSN